MNEFEMLDRVLNDLRIDLFMHDGYYYAHLWDNEEHVVMCSGETLAELIANLDIETTTYLYT